MKIHLKVQRAKVPDHIYTQVMDDSERFKMSVGDYVYTLVNHQIENKSLSLFYHPCKSVKNRQIRFTEKQLDEIMKWAELLDITAHILIHTVIIKHYQN